METEVTIEEHRAALAQSLPTDPTAQAVKVNGELFYLKSLGQEFFAAYTPEGMWLGQGSEYEAKFAMAAWTTGETW